MAPIAPIDALTLVATRLSAAGVPWMLTGSVAAFLYGRDRSTADIDIVIDCSNLNPGSLVEALKPEYFLDDEMARDGVATRETFNAIPMMGGPKIDLIPLKNDRFDQVAFRRRETLDWHGTTLYVISARDLVVSKLSWARSSMSERQLADVRAIMSTGLVDEDEDFRRWIAELGLEKALEASREARYDA